MGSVVDILETGNWYSECLSELPKFADL